MNPTLSSIEIRVRLFSVPKSGGVKHTTPSVLLAPHDGVKQLVEYDETKYVVGYPAIVENGMNANQVAFDVPRTKTDTSSSSPTGAAGPADLPSKLAVEVFSILLF